MGVGAAIAGASVIGAGATAYGANKAAEAQKAAADKASQVQMDMFNRTAGYLSPYRDAGQNALTKQLEMAKNGFHFAPTMAELEKTPGYQFNLSQGLKSTQNSAAARGLGSSGAAMRGAADYASGLAANTFQQQFANALQQYQTNYNNLNTISTLGENAAAGTGAAATQTGSSIGNNITGAGNAQAAAWMSGANAIGNASNNALLGYLWANKQGLFSGNPYDPSWSNTSLT